MGEEHMSYAWLQMFTRAKEEHRKRLGEVRGVVDVDAEEGGEEEGADASSMRSSKSSGSKVKVCRHHKAPKLPAKSGGHARVAEAGDGGGGGGSPPARQAPGGRAAGAGGGAAGNGGGAGRGPSPGAGPQTQAEAGRARAATGRADGRGGDRGGGGGRYEVPYAGEPGLEGPGNEGEGGALSSGRHCAPAAFPEGRADLRVGGAEVSSCLGQP